jgi:hypothetical protein
MIRITDIHIILLLVLSLTGCTDKPEPVQTEKTANTAPVLDNAQPLLTPNLATSASSDAELEAAILSAAPDYKADIVSDPSMKSRYVAVRADLNSDGKDEVFVYLKGGFFCGSGGCNLLLFSQGMDGYSLLADISTSDPPIIVSEVKNDGYADFWRMQSGGGPSEYVQHSYQNGKYSEKSRIPSAKAPAGKEILAASTDYASGTVLEPSD